ncbi:hypothetical protein HS088_TW09G00627 [Tripterygium wilfordii]|uniref:Nucleoside phosphorylase domain-containing protein n=1 Tax=Tripterygium wilfordii TaxID=458696 RepID=A0A7J7D939_TRIWF|nr:bark storage protein A-like [Tripterygium wilfordii]KAF5742576.1 hypothetical protein HS088_TW09G00627 [Tripterygium wilfordii]
MAEKLVNQSILVLVLLSTVGKTVSAIPSNVRKSLNIVKEINRRGPYIGLITVFATEENAFFGTGAFKPKPKHPFVDLSGRRFRIGKIFQKNVIYVRCGIGMVNAAAATQQMLDVFDISGIIHFGIAGNLNDSMSIGDVTIPKQFANTGVWNWMNINGSVDPVDVAHLNIGSYNVPEGNETNMLGEIGYSPEQMFSESGGGEPTSIVRLFWLQVSHHWIRLAAGLEGMELEQCVNTTMCLPQKPKLVVGLKGSTANTFVDNGAYRYFLYKTFEVSSADMESSAIVMTSLSNGFPMIVIRGISDLAGKQSGDNAWSTFGSLAALNCVKAVLQFIRKLPQDSSAGC